MDITERRTPQDGRLWFPLGRGSRSSSLFSPTQYGEKIVIRLLETSAPLSPFADLGIPDDVAESLTDLLSLPQGTAPGDRQRAPEEHDSLQFAVTNCASHRQYGRTPCEDPGSTSSPALTVPRQCQAADVCGVPALDSPASIERHHGGRDSR